MFLTHNWPATSCPCECLTQNTQQVQHIVRSSVGCRTGTTTPGTGACNAHTKPLSALPVAKLSCCVPTAAGGRQGHKGQLTDEACAAVLLCTSSFHSYVPLPSRFPVDICPDVWCLGAHHHRSRRAARPARSPKRTRAASGSGRAGAGAAAAAHGSVRSGGPARRGKSGAWRLGCWRMMWTTSSWWRQQRTRRSLMMKVGGWWWWWAQLQEGTKKATVLRGGCRAGSSVAPLAGMLCVRTPTALIPTTTVVDITADLFPHHAISPPCTPAGVPEGEEAYGSEEEDEADRLRRIDQAQEVRRGTG